MATLDWSTIASAGGRLQVNTIRRAIVSWICSFCGTEADLLTRFGLSGEAQLVREALRWALETKHIELYRDDSGRPPFYIPTERGMSFAAMGYGSRYLSMVGQRSQTYSRTVASVLAALANLTETDEEYEEYRDNFRLWDQWALRSAGRDRKRSYKFAVNAAADEGTHMRLPAAVFYPTHESSYRPVLVEVLSEDMLESEIRSILVNRHRRPDVLCVFCYAAAVHHEFVWQTILEIGAQEKIIVYSMPPGADAAQLMELEPDAVPDSGQLVADILECVGEFEMASIAGLADYLQMGEHHLQMLLGGAVEKDLLSESRAIVDGVSVYSLTKAGLEEVELQRPVVDVTMQGARQAKERLRVAAVLKRERGSDWIVMSRSQIALPGDEQNDHQIPWIEVKIRGAQQRKLYADLILLERKAPKKPPVVAMLITKRYTPLILNTIAAAWAQRTEDKDARLAREAILYVYPELALALKRHVRALGAGKRVRIEPLLEAELVIKEDRARAREEQKRREAVERQSKRAAAEQSRQKVRRLQRAPGESVGPMTSVGLRTPGRGLIVAPDSEKLPGTQWISDASAKVIESLLRSRGVDIDDWVVHWRYIVNVALWCVERGRRFRPLSAQTYGISRHTFELRVLLMYNVGVWQAIPGILKQQAENGLEVDRGIIKWGLIHVDEFTEQMKYAAKSGRYRLRGDPPRYIRPEQDRNRDFTSSFDVPDDWST